MTAEYLLSPYLLSWCLERFEADGYVLHIGRVFMCNPSRRLALCHCISPHASCRVESGGEYAILDEMVVLFVYPPLVKGLA